MTMRPQKMTSHVFALFVLHVTLYIHGAQTATCNTPISLSDSNIITSSEEPGFEKDKVGLDCCQNEVGAAWCPKKDDANPFLEIRLNNPTIVGKMAIGPPTKAPNTYPGQFMKTFDLKFKLPEYSDFISIGQNLKAIHNKTVSLSTLNLLPPLRPQIIRIEPKSFESLACFKLALFTCDTKTLCPTNFCQNGGVCSGINTCDCTQTKGFYGSQCQYTADNIPKSLTEFLKVVSKTVMTTTYTLTVHGTVTVSEDHGVTSLVIPPASYVDMPIAPTDPCLKDLDKCTSGFSISVVFRFTSLDIGRKYVISNGGDGQNPFNVKGVQLFFQQNKVICVVGTSDQLWVIQAPVTPLVAAKWYEMTITWSPGRGLQLLGEGTFIGSSVLPTPMGGTVSTQKTVLGFLVRTTNAILTVNRVMIVPMFWKEAERAGIHRGQPNPVTTTQTLTTATTTPKATSPAPLPECKTALGMKDGSITDAQITVSSSQTGHGKEKLRAGCCQREEDGGWCADPADQKPWVQIDLGKPTALSAVSFLLPGRPQDTVIPQNYVKTVRMEYDDPYDNTTTMKVYNDNIPVTYNATLSYKISLKPKIVTTSVRMYITKAQGDACFRFELIGCDPNDLCPANWCYNKGTCNGERKCKCQDGHFGERCQLDKTEITPKETTFQEIVNKTLVTSTGQNLTVDGNVTIAKVDETTKIIQVTDGGTVTFPEDKCLHDLTSCTSGFTLTLVLKVVTLTDDDITILTSGGDNKDSTGLVLIYNKLRHTLTYTIKDHTQSWTVMVTPFTWVESHWYKLTLTWSPSSGPKIIVDDRIIGSKTGSVSSPPASTTNALCIGCTYVDKTTTTTTTTTKTTILVKSVTKVHIYITDLVRANLVDVKERKPSPPKECDDSKKDLVFKDITQTEVVTSLGNVKAHGALSVVKEDNDVILVLDDQGEYIEVFNTSSPCIDDITTCTTNLTYRITFRFTEIHIEPNFILSSGGDLSASTGFALYYYHGSLNFWVKDGIMVWMAIYRHTLDVGKWYTMDASWSHVTGIQLRIDGVLIKPFIMNGHPANPVTEKHPLHIARSPLPEKNSTSSMDILLFRVWTKTVEELTELGCTDDLTVNNPPPRAITTDAAPTTEPPLTETKINFKQIIGNKIITTHTDLTIIGTVTLEKIAVGQVLVLETPGSYVDLGKTGIPCIDDVSSCTSGFNFRFVFSLLKISNKPQVLISSGADTNQGKGLTIRYYNKQLVIYIKRATDTIVGTFLYELVNTYWYTLDVTWSVRGGLKVHINNLIISGTPKTIFHPKVTVTYTFLLGKSPQSNDTTSMKIFEIDLWTRIYTRITQKRLQLPNFRAPNTVDPNAPTTTTTPLPTTPETTTVLTTTTPYPEFTWTLKGVTRQILVSHELKLTLVGRPPVDTDGVVLGRGDTYLKIPNLQNSCLTNPDRCMNGFTFEVDVKLTTLEEGSIIFTSGGERPNAPGITMIYRYGFIHVIASTPTQSWYLTVSRRIIRTKTFCKIHVSWSKTTTLKLFINQVMVGVAENPLPHVNTTTSIKTELTIGGGPVRCVIREVHIWLVHIDILINLGVVNAKGTTIAPVTTAPTTTAAPTTTTTQADTTDAPTTTTTTEAATTTTTEADTTTETPTYPTTNGDSNQCPAGCRPKDECYTPPPSTASTTAPPTTPAPTTQPPPPPKTTTTTTLATTPTTTPTTNTTPTTTPTTTTTTPTTTTPTTTTTTTTPTTTTTTTTPTTTSTTTTTTTTPTTTTEIGCPDLSSSIMLVPATDTNGQALMTCVLSTIPANNVEVQFTWAVLGHNTEWHATIQSPDKAAPLMVSTMDVRIEDRKIVCSAKARYLVTGAKWCSNKLTSNIIHAQIKLTTTHQITVVEGRENQTVDVTTTVPPSAFCQPEDNGRCTVVITTVIETMRHELRCSRREIMPQAVLGVTAVGSGTSASCGVPMTKDNWSKVIAIPVKATIDRIRDRDWMRKLIIGIKITGEITRRTTVKIIGTVNVKVINRDRRATCSSVNDPHMTTFDRVRYNNFIPGEFVLYKHRTMEYEVRTLYRLCNTRRPNGATCNLGVAVRSGDDVITFTTDPRSRSRNSVIAVQLYLNGQLTPGTTITRIGCGQKYEVFLPTGTIITIVASRKPFINVYVKATSTDFEQTEGLCGNFNGNSRDDLQGASGRNPNVFSMKWIRTVTMFRGVVAMTIPRPPTYCSCQSNQAPMCQPGLDVYQCHTVSRQTTDITAVIIRTARVSTVTVSVRRRYRRAAVDDLPDDNQLEESTVGWSHENATQYCTNYLEQNDKVKKCQSYVDVNETTESIRSCAEDLQALGDPEWASSHLDHILEECLTDAQNDPEVWTPSNSTDDDTPQPPADIVNGLCRLDCGQHGTCVEGTCQCSNGWTGEQCDVGKQTKPEVLVSREPCDMLESSEKCRSVRIDGDKFVESDTLTCTFKYVDIGNKVTPSGDQNVKVPAEFVSMYNVICPLPEPLQGSATTSAARSAIITVSNDGTTPSDQRYLHVVYKSSCQYCTLAAGSLGATCRYLENSCLIDGQCYARFEKFEGDECYRCDPTISKNTWTRTSEPKCMVTAAPTPNGVKTSVVETDDDDKHTIIIVLGVVCAVLALAIIGVAFIVCKTQNKGRKDQLLYSAPKDTHPSFDIGRSTVTQPSKIGDVSEMPDASRLNTYVNPTFEQ